MERIFIVVGMEHVYLLVYLVPLWMHVDIWRVSAEKIFIMHTWGKTTRFKP
jgi:hypothetical protein